ncbi:MAG: phosphate acyltransferase PlsX [Cardiobacteriaceae bacterium]|nr:phosphate acyltransferase PlsX [Cardiobacteriaceae bacterium]
MTTIAIDAMGGDIGLDTTIAAVSIAQKKLPEVKFILCGNEEKIRSHQYFSELKSENIEIVQCSQVVEMDESPSQVLRKKQDSSLWRAIELVRDKKADVCVSAGNTGALMASAYFLLKTLPDVSRPALCTAMPTRTGRVYCLDLGATVDSKPQQLEQFALMGTELVRAVVGKENPTVGLLNIGGEAIKGNEVVKEASKLLAEAPINYIGNVEGDDILMKENLDIVVCDGFVGNVALKSIEGTAKFIALSLKQAFHQNLLSKICGLFALPAMKTMKKKIDPRLYNGAVMLGLNGLVVKSHGSADAFSYSNAIFFAVRAAEKSLIEKITAQIRSRNNAENSQDVAKVAE